MRRTCLPVLLLCLLVSSVHSQWIKQSVDTKASFRGLAVVNEKVVWASGTGGTVIKTIDGGKSWKAMTVPGAEKLDFRDIEAFDANTAYILSIGNGDSSRIYKTTDGGATWNLQFKNTNPRAFFDAMACWGRNNCIAMSDPVDGKFPLVSTKDGGANWRPIDTSKMPPAKSGEAAFAASGTCLITQGKSNAFFVTGGSAARVFRSTDRGISWTVADTPIVHGTSGSGIFSIAMYDGQHGVIVGGNYEIPDSVKNGLASTADGGLTWSLGTGLNGYRSDVVYVDNTTLLAAGTNGSDISRDGGSTWLRIDDAHYNAVSARGNKSIWAVGPNGYAAHLDWQEFLAVNGYKPCLKDMICDGPILVDLHLDHDEISSNCRESDSVCSEARQIKVATTSQEVPPNWYEYSVSDGQIVGFGPNVMWDLTHVNPGTYTITVGLKLPFGDGYMVFGKTITKSILVK